MTWDSERGFLTEEFWIITANEVAKLIQSSEPQSAGKHVKEIGRRTQGTPHAGVDRVLFPGAILPASLVTELNSETPGPIIAQVTQSIYDSATGRTRLIAQGARLMGDHRSSTRDGQSGVAIFWSRLIMAKSDELMLEEALLEPSGAAGVRGEVDNHGGALCSAPPHSVRSSTLASPEPKRLSHLQRHRRRLA